MDRFPHEFSAGAAASAFRSRALAVERISSSDEPISALDVNIQAQSSPDDWASGTGLA